MTDEEKSQQKELNKKQHQDRRSKLTDEEKTPQKKQDKIRHQNRRSKMTDEVKSQQKDLNKTQHQGRRQNKKSTQAALNASYQQDFSTNHDEVSNVVQDFLKVIQDGPTYVCCVCYRMLYKHLVKGFTDIQRQMQILVAGNSYSR